MKAIIGKLPFVRSLSPVSLSIVIHLVAVWLLLALGILRVDLLLDRDEARAQSQEASARQAVREAKARAKRQRLKLSKEHAKKLRKEADRATQRRLRVHVASLLAKYDQIKQLKIDKLDEIGRRTPNEIQNRALEDLRARAKALVRESKQLSKRYKHPVRSEVAELAEQAANTTDKFLDREDSESASRKKFGNELSDDAVHVENRAHDAATSALRNAKGRLELAYPEDKQVHQLAQQFHEAVRRAVGEAPDLKLFNDTSSAQPFDDARFQNAATLTAPGDLYQTARELEAAIGSHYDDFRVGELAVDQNTSFDDARRKLAGIGTPERPDLQAELFSLQQQLSDAYRENGSARVSDLTNYRQSLSRANDVAGQMDLRAGDLLSQALGQDGFGQGDSSGIMGALYGLPVGGPGFGPVLDPRFHREIAGGRFMAHVDSLPGISIPRKKIFAEAMTGRRFSRNSPRKGWLYLDTWYLIGPWENHGRINYANVHPPEKGIDFDATYYDGKRGRELRWKYIQSNSIRVIPENAPGDATWYAYTELYFEEPMEILLAVASDDATKVWINNQVVWQENGLSQWSMGEGVRKVMFRQGTNTVLVRVENGPGETIFSVVICPPEAAGGRE